MPQQPAVSILLAAYNADKYVRQAMDSLLGQTFRDFEVVAIDDASQDETFAILREYAARDARVVTHRNERNMKLAASLNRGLELCKAPLVARADADDYYPLDRIEKQFAYIKKHPETDVLSTSFYRVSEAGVATQARALPVEHDQIRLTLLWQSPICHASAMYRREAVLAVGGYDPKFAAGQDYDLWARMSETARFHNLAEPLMFYRYHEKSTLANRSLETVRMWAGVSNRLIARYLGREVSLEESQPFVNLLCGYSALSEQDHEPSLRMLSEFLSRVNRRETPSIQSWAARTAARAILKHSEMLSYDAPGRSRRLLRRCAASAICGGDAAAVLKQVLRLCAAGPLRRLKARAGSRQGGG